MLSDHPLRATAAALLVLTAVVVAYLRLGRPPIVDPVGLEVRDVRETLVVAGRVRPPSSAELGAVVAGTAREVLAREGDEVVPGQILVRLDDREARAALSEAEARLVEVQSTARDEIRRAALELEQATRDLERVQAVFAAGGLTRQRVEQAEQRAADAASRLEAARAEATPTGENAAVGAARAAVEAARARLDLTTVRAPYRGVVLQRLVEPGAAVRPGVPLLEVAQHGPVEIAAFPSEDNLGRLHRGAPATVSPDAYPEEAFSATLSLVTPRVDPSQGTVEIRLRVDDPPPYLRPGMTLSVNLETGRREEATILPVDVVRGLGTDDPWVLVVEEGRAERRSVEIGLRGDAFVEIVSGLGSDDRVVPPGAGLDPGDRVRVRVPGS